MRAADGATNPRAVCTVDNWHGLPPRLSEIGLEEVVYSDTIRAISTESWDLAGLPFVLLASASFLPTQVSSAGRSYEGKS